MNMNRMLGRVAVLAAGAAFLPPLAAGPHAGQSQAQQPVFRSTVELVRVDVQVIDRSAGQPILGLGIDDFHVWLDGRPRRVASAELVSFEPVPDPLTDGPLRTPGMVPEDARVYVVAIDQLGLPPAAIMPVREAVRRFFRQLRPQDMAAVYEFPYRPGGLNITHDRQEVIRSLDRVFGMRESRVGMFSLAPSEITDITANDSDALNKVISRECEVTVPPNDGCAESVRMEAHSLASRYELEASQRMSEMARLAQGLSRIQGRKTVLLVSGGLLASTRPSGRPDVQTMMTQVGDQIANAQASLYVLHLDSLFLDAYSATMGPSRRPSDRFESVTDDRIALTTGLEQLAGRSGGALFSVDAGTPEHVLDRVLRETGAFYVLGVEPTDEDRDGREHFIRVRTTAGSATVRSRVQVRIPLKK